MKTQDKKPFSFKKFIVHDDQCQMKVGTDGVLVGAWVDVSGVSRVLDIGTGSGLIALMVAQRTPNEVIIDAVENLEPDARQAKENADRSPWSQRIHVHCSTIQNFSRAKYYDLIVSNPPYF